ncbi:class I SAM-dependent methyltransferase [Streptomyces verrucosisporus]|uniref:class I SAM-dependent methyltransferase n=1 Tax=Streptomyces verrucosisporus TaxID=1695161 RepID=UPI0019D1C484|nr:class I SAM-dependent methyltransferase [Streptomyces verrucosisporus]MBN3931211.1 class I SAM-dependent methyltransferase [Streptomyces verrucosisporus]
MNLNFVTRGESTVPDPYAASAPYIDPLIAGFWHGTAPALTAELKSLSTLSGPVADLGAGSGRGVRAVASALPGVSVLAVEPSPAMRTALLARLVDDPVLRTTVTVIAADAQTYDFPRSPRAVLAMNMLGHLAPEQRRRLWAKIAWCLEPGGALLVNNQRPHTPVAVPRAAGGTFRVGEQDYEGWIQAEPSGAERLTWRMTYRTLHEGRCVSETTADYEWWTVTDDELRAEWAEHHLTSRTAGEEKTAFHVVSRSGGPVS